MAVEAAARRRAAARMKAKEAAVGAAARVLIYPTLLYNEVRGKVQAEFRWWDEVDQFILLGAVPFRRDVPRLKKLGVKGVITLNEPFETLVPSSLYQARNASRGSITYIHCKAGRGRSTTVVLCYLVKYKNMTPAAAFEYIRSIRARVLLTRSQWKVVQEFSKNTELLAVTKAAVSPAGDAVPLTEAGLAGDDAPDVLTDDASLPCHKGTPSRPMIKMLSCLLPSHKGSDESSLARRQASEVRAC